MFGCRRPPSPSLGVISSRRSSCNQIASLSRNRNSWLSPLRRGDSGGCAGPLLSHCYLPGVLCRTCSAPHLSIRPAAESCTNRTGEDPGYSCMNRSGLGQCDKVSKIVTEASKSAKQHFGKRHGFSKVNEVGCCGPIWHIWK